MRACWGVGWRGYKLPSAIVALMMALCAVGVVHLIGYRFGAITRIIDTLETIPAGVALFYLGIGAVVFCGVGACLIVAYGAYGRALERHSRTPVESFGSVLRARFGIFFAIIVACWLPWVIAHLPGAFDDDTVWQLLIWHNPDAWVDHHPWFTTALYGAFIDAGIAMGSSSIGLIAHSILVMVLCAASFSFMLCYLRRFNVPKPLFYACLVCIGVVPLFASYASETVKDTSFSWAWVVFCVLFAECVRTRGQCLSRLRYPLGLALLGLWMCLTRKTGVYLVVLMLLVLLFVIAPRKRTLVAGMAAGLAVCMVVYSSVLLPAWGVASGSSKEIFSLMLQQTARTVNLYPDDISSEERAAIDAVVSVDDMQECYHPFLADPVKDRWRDPSVSDIAAYAKTWAVMGLRHPLTYVAASFLNSKDLFIPYLYFETKNDMNAEWVDELGVFFYNGGDAQADAVMLDGLKQFTALDAPRNALNAYEFVLCYRTPARMMFSMSFLSFWLPLIVVLFVVRSRSRVTRGACCLALAPCALLALTLLVGPIVIPRYCLPAAFVFPLVLMMPFVFAKRADTP